MLSENDQDLVIMISCFDEAFLCSFAIDISVSIDYYWDIPVEIDSLFGELW